MKEGDYFHMDQEIRTGIVLTVSLLLHMVGLLFAVKIDPYIRKQHRKIMLIIIAFVFSLIIQNVLGYLIDLNGTMP